MREYSVRDVRKRLYHRAGRMSKSEVMLIVLLFHCSGYRCMKHFYLEKVCKGMHHMFPSVVSYNRFVELQKEIRRTHEKKSPFPAHAVRKRDMMFLV